VWSVTVHGGPRGVLFLFWYPHGSVISWDVVDLCWFFPGIMELYGIPLVFWGPRHPTMSKPVVWSIVPHLHPKRLCFFADQSTGNRRFHHENMWISRCVSQLGFEMIFLPHFGPCRFFLYLGFINAFIHSGNLLLAN
jgi:hypothetical protein